MSKIEGIFVPNIVPFDEEGKINENELRRQTNWLIDKGVSGLYPNGSSGEFIRLSFEERKRIIAIMSSEVKGRVPILAGGAEANVEMILEACETYADYGCSAVSVTGPYYYNVSQESIEELFREIAAKSPIGIVMYNIPQFSNEISVPVVRRLALDCPNIIGIKDSSRDMPRFINTLNEIKPQRPEFSILVGCEEILYPTLVMGGDGGTIATSGVVPEAVMKLYNCFLSGELDEAKRIQFKLLDLINTMLYAPDFPHGFRIGYELRGFNMGSSRYVLSSREKEELGNIRSKVACLLTECGFEEAASNCQKSRADLVQPFVGTTLADKQGSSRNVIDVDKIVDEVLRNLGKI